MVLYPTAIWGAVPDGFLDASAFAIICEGEFTPCGEWEGGVNFHGDEAIFNIPCVAETPVSGQVFVVVAAGFRRCFAVQAETRRVIDPAPNCAFQPQRGIISSSSLSPVRRLSPLSSFFKVKKRKIITGTPITTKPHPVTLATFSL